MKSGLSKHKILNSNFRELKLIKIFKDLNPEDLKFLQSHSRLLSVKQNQYLFHAGDMPSALYIVSKGSLKILRETQTGHALITRIVGPGKMVGLREIFIDATYLRSCVALQDAEVFSIHHEAVRTLIRKNSEVSWNFIILFSRELTRMENVLESYLYRSAKSRLASILYDFYQMFEPQFSQRSRTSQDSLSFVSPLQRKDIAALAGMTPETVSRTLSEFKKEKILVTKGKHFTVLDPNALKNYSEEA